MWQDKLIWTQLKPFDKQWPAFYAPRESIGKELTMAIDPHSLAERDIKALIHPFANLAMHRERGPLILERGKCMYVWDREGKHFGDSVL
jgi:hypothetical protein